MTICLDSSSIVKLFVEESESEAVQALVDASETRTTSVVAYPETRAAFARLARERRITGAQLANSRRAFDGWWPSVVAISVDDALCRTAGALAERHALRGFDSVHLACYLDVIRRTARRPVTFSSFDERLNRAARVAARR